MPEEEKTIAVVQDPPSAPVAVVPDPPETIVENPPSKSSDLSDRFASVLGPAIPFGLMFYFFVWRNLPFTTTVKWIVTGIVVVIAALVYIFLKAATVRIFEVIGNGIIVVFIVFAVGMCSILFTVENQNQLFKIFVILYFSLLPPWLYLQFISTKGKTLWDEYVLNLFRLHIDDYANLPAPPKRSAFYDGWARAYQDATGQNEKSIYRKKFEGLFGPVPETETTNFAVFQGENLWPVAIATMIISAGWVLVVKPETIFSVSFMPEGFQASGIPRIPVDAFRFAFLGAYFYVLQMLVRRYFQNDLKTSAYVNSTMRIIIVILLVWTLDLLMGDKAPSQRLAIAFAIGVFPHVGWQALQALIKLPLKLVIPSLRQQFPLSDLDGLNIWYESRLLEEGIEDMQNLATANLVDVMLNTRIPVERLVDWVDQSLLYLHLDKAKEDDSDSDRAKLRRYGVRTATDLEDVFDARALFEKTTSKREEFIEKFERVLNTEKTEGSTRDVGEPSVVLSIVATLKNEPNLYHVREWKTFADRNLAKKKRHEPASAPSVNTGPIAAPTHEEEPEEEEEEPALVILSNTR